MKSYNEIYVIQWTDGKKYMLGGEEVEQTNIIKERFKENIIEWKGKSNVLLEKEQIESELWTVRTTYYFYVVKIKWKNVIDLTDWI